MDRELSLIYLECLEFDRHQLAQTHQELLDYRQAKEGVERVLSQLRQHPELSPHLKTEETDIQDLPVYLEAMLKQINGLITQGLQPQLLAKVRHALVHALPRIWIPESTLTEQLIASRKLLIDKARLFKNPKIASLWPAIKQVPPETQAELLLNSIEASLTHHGINQTVLLVTTDRDFEKWMRRSAQIDNLIWQLCQTWQEAAQEALIRPPAAVVFCLRSDQPQPDESTLKALMPAEIIAVVAGFDLVSPHHIPQGVSQVLEAQWVAQLLPLWLQHASKRHWQDRLQQTHDFLTDLPTPLGLYPLYRQQQKLNSQIHAQMSLAILSAQPFHLIEKEHGPYLASQWIKAFEYLLQTHLPKTDLLARWAPDKFILLMPNTRLQQAIQRLEELTSIMKQAPALPNLHHHTIQTGVISVPGNICYEEALHHAYTQLTRAKRSNLSIACDTDKLQATQQHHVVMIDDDPITLEILQFVFQREGFQTSSLSNGTEVFSILQEQRISLLILDLHMPGMNGFEILEAVRRQPEYDELSIVMLTSSKEEGDIERGFALGANDYLFKPFSPTELLIRSRRFLR